MRLVDGRRWHNVDLFAAGVPCPPFSIAGKQLGINDDRDMFPDALRLIKEMQPRAVLLENVPGFASEKFKQYRTTLLATLHGLGYEPEWRILQAADYGVPQLRPRFILVALPKDRMPFFEWPAPNPNKVTVGNTLKDLMASRGWKGAERWRQRAQQTAPTIVGGSKKHGGPDLGPTRAREQWRELGVDGLGIADEPPPPDFPVDGRPRLTVRMVARIQGFPDFWKFSGKKTTAYRQVGNAFPPPVAAAVGRAIADALDGRYSATRSRTATQMRLLESPVPYC
jgi:DNA (cytosine-5)-methyltransferase 1